MSRTRLLVLALACIIAMPLLALLMVAQALIGGNRALRMAIAIDQCGNAALGGSEDETISSRTGRHANAGKRWALCLQRCIDLLFGEGHCQASIGE
jgi:hypothetical protein